MKGSVGEEHLRTAKLMNNIANVLHAMARSEEAKELFIEVIAILEKNLGPENPDIALALNNSALVFKDTGDYAGARIRSPSRDIRITSFRKQGTPVKRPPQASVQSPRGRRSRSSSSEPG